MMWRLKQRRMKQMNDKYLQTARQLRLAKLEYEVAQATADAKKKIYEALRVQMANDMVSGQVPRFDIKPTDDLSGMSFRLETKDRYSAVTENKDELIEVLKIEAPDLFTITAPALSKYINDIVAENNGELPDRFKNLVKLYEDTHVVVRTKK